MNKYRVEFVTDKSIPVAPGQLNWAIIGPNGIEERFRTEREAVDELMTNYDWRAPASSPPETYYESIQVAADEIEWGSDHMADWWGPCVALKLGEDYYDDSLSPWSLEEIDLANHLVYADICRQALADWEAVIERDKEILRQTNPNSRLLTTAWEDLP